MTGGQSPTDTRARTNSGLMSKVVATLNDDTDDARESARVLEPSRGVLSDIAGELRWTLRGRKGWLIGLGFNLVIAIVYVVYEHINVHLHDDIRISGIATGVTAWVLCDVINTNQLGADRHRVLAHLGRGDSLAHILVIKNLALCVLLAPFAVGISIGARLMIDRWRNIPHAILLDLWVVFAWLALGSLISVFLPYRPIPLSERWKARTTWLRYAICLAAPYAAYGIFQFVRYPADHVAHALLGTHLEHHERDWSLICFAWGLTIWGISLLVCNIYATRSPEKMKNALSGAR